VGEGRGEGLGVGEGLGEGGIEGEGLAGLIGDEVGLGVGLIRVF